MSKHTPGPWKVNEVNAPGIFNKSYLVAAAPELLGRFRGIADQIEAFDEKCAEAEYTDTAEAWDLLHEIQLSANAAIIKAEDR